MREWSRISRPAGFAALNVFGLLVTAALALAAIRRPTTATALGLIAWLSFAMLANGIAHLVAAIAERGYVPGMVTAGVLYLLYYGLATAALRRDRRVRPGPALLAPAAGALPMIVQAFGILAAGRRWL